MATLKCKAGEPSPYGDEGDFLWAAQPYFDDKGNQRGTLSVLIDGGWWNLVHLLNGFDEDLLRENVNRVVHAIRPEVPTIELAIEELGHFPRFHKGEPDMTPGSFHCYQIRMSQESNVEVKPKSVINTRFRCTHVWTEMWPNLIIEDDAEFLAEHLVEAINLMPVSAVSNS